jgi:hypothetical protein
MRRGDVKLLKAKFEKFQKTAQRLLTTHPQHVERVLYIQECTFNLLKKADPALRMFCREIRHRPLFHASFRDCLRSQYQDVYILRWNESPGEKMLSHDCNDLFSGRLIAIWFLRFGDNDLIL